MEGRLFGAVEGVPGVSREREAGLEPSTCARFKPFSLGQHRALQSPSSRPNVVLGVAQARWPTCSRARWDCTVNFKENRI